MNYSHSMNGSEQVTSGVELNRQAAMHSTTSRYASNFSNTAT